MSYTVEIKGLREVQATFNKMPQQLKKEAAGILENGAKVWVRNAKRDAPVNFGVLRNTISYAKLGELSFEVVSRAKYSPYLEWGTITRVSVPAGQEAYAILFKGRGLRKTGGIFPHPFFFKQQIPTQIQIEKGIGSLLNDVKL